MSGDIAWVGFRLKPEIFQADPLDRLRVAIEDAERQQQADTDNPSFCVVSNRTVSEIIAAFRELEKRGKSQ